MESPFFRARSPDNRFTVEVKVPENSPEDGEGVLFTCSVTLDDRDVIEMFKTDDQHKMVLWVRNQMEEAMRRSAPFP